jgi:hypothetical protein
LIVFCVDGKRTTRLYDLKSDPSELRNLAGDGGMEPVLTRMRGLLESERKRLHDGDSEAAHLVKMSEEFWLTYEQAE